VHKKNKAKRRGTDSKQIIVDLKEKKRRKTPTTTKKMYKTN